SQLLLTRVVFHSFPTRRSSDLLLFCSLFAMIVAALHVISHTRKEEDLGLTELVRSFQVGRQANSLATIIETVFINILLALFITVDRKSTRLNSSHVSISYAVFC